MADMKLLFVILWVAVVVQVTFATEWLVGPGEAFTSIRECVEGMADGDSCGVFGGDDSTGQLRYRDEDTIMIRGLLDESLENRLYGYGKYKPIVDGTVLISSQNSDWHQDAQGRWYLDIEEDIWQLFVDDVDGTPQMQVVARWPDASWVPDEDGKRQVFNSSNWSKYQQGVPPHESQSGSAANSYTGRLYDSRLAALGVDLTGGVAILNIGSWCTFNGKIRDHAAGQPWFQYDDRFNVGASFYNWLKGNHNQYYIEGKLGLLDSPGEWHIEPCSEVFGECHGNFRLYMFDNPVGKTIRGKVQTYAIEIKQCKNLAIENIEFFATTIKATPASDADTELDLLKFYSNHFHHASCSKRIKGIASPPQQMIINAWPSRNTLETAGSLDFIDNIWFGSDGTPIEYGGKHVRFINNMFSNNDWSNANQEKQTGGIATVHHVRYPQSCRLKNKKVPCNITEIFERNTLVDNGAAHGIQPAGNTLITLNDISGQCWGKIQNDGGGVQVNRPAQELAVTSYNWFYDSPKYGLRFDCPNKQDLSKPLKLGKNGHANHNVAWNTNGFNFKGNGHHIYHNLVFKKKSKKPNRSNCALCVPFYIGNLPAMNNGTEVDMNVADLADGLQNTTIRSKPVLGMAGDVYLTPNKDNSLTQPRNRINFSKISNKNDVNDVYDLNAQLADIDCLDFRPIKTDSYTSDLYTSSGIAGPYDVEGEYWIPGRQEDLPTRPVPRDGCAARAQYRDVLIFLEPYDPNNEIVHYIINIAKNRHPGDELVPSAARLIKGRNIINLNTFFPGFSMKSGDVVEWRVDTLRSGNQLTKGNQWQFSTI